MAATIYHALGIPQTAVWKDDLDRPHAIYHGRPIPELTAKQAAPFDATTILLEFPPGAEVQAGTHSQLTSTSEYGTSIQVDWSVCWPSKVNVAVCKLKNH